MSDEREPVTVELQLLPPEGPGDEWECRIGEASGFGEDAGEAARGALEDWLEGLDG